MRDKEDKEYFDKLKHILTSTGRNGVFSSSGPAQLMDHVFLGNRDDANNTRLLKRLKITHILNCAAETDYSLDLELQENPYDPETTGVKRYMKFEAKDTYEYPILRHYKLAHQFMEDARLGGGRVMVHCQMGVNRSAALCTVYIMNREKLTLLQAVRKMKIERPVVLVNEGFVKQLLEYAKENDLLYKKNFEISSGAKSA